MNVDRALTRHRPDGATRHTMAPATATFPVRPDGFDWSECHRLVTAFQAPRGAARAKRAHRRRGRGGDHRAPVRDARLIDHAVLRVLSACTRGRHHGAGGCGLQLPLHDGHARGVPPSNSGDGRARRGVFQSRPEPSHHRAISTSIPERGIEARGAGPAPALWPSGRRCALRGRSVGLQSDRAGIEAEDGRG